MLCIALLLGGLGCGNDEAALPDAALGSASSPAESCKTLHTQRPDLPSGPYYVSGGIGPGFQVYCDMSTADGGWTNVTTNVPEETVTALRGISGRQMIKCTLTGGEHIVSPAWSGAWHWSGTTFHQVGGTWMVNGAQVECGTDPEYTDVTCPTWWGAGCGNGPGPSNKLFPGVIDQAPFCGGSTSAHANGSFVICGVNNYRSYAVFVRSE